MYQDVDSGDRSGDTAWIGDLEPDTIQLHDNSQCEETVMSKGRGTVREEVQRRRREVNNGSHRAGALLTRSLHRGPHRRESVLGFWSDRSEAERETWGGQKFVEHRRHAPAWVAIPICTSPARQSGAPHRHRSEMTDNARTGDDRGDSVRGSSTMMVLIEGRSASCGACGGDERDAVDGVVRSSRHDPDQYPTLYYCPPHAPTTAS